MRGWKWGSRKYDNIGHGDEVRRDIRILKSIKNIKVWQLLIILLALSLLAIIFLRLNNLEASELYEDLKAADKTGEVARVQKSAKKFQNYVANHMNTSFPRLPLQTLYDAAVQKALDTARPAEVSSTVYQKATEDCIPDRLSGGSKAWARCVREKVGASDSTGFLEAESISPDAYYIEYASARWSPDAAGITLLICFLVSMIIIVRIMFAVILRVILKFKYRAI